MTFILTFMIVALVIAGMAIGVIFGRGPIKGSCGGMSAVGIDSNCEICGGNPNKCEKEQQRQSTHTNLSYDASQSVDKDA